MESIEQIRRKYIKTTMQQRVSLWYSMLLDILRKYSLNADFKSPLS